MDHTREQIVAVLRDAAEHWWFDFRKEFRRADNSVNFPAVRQQLLATCGVTNSGVWTDQQPVARCFESLEPPEKAALVDDALAVYGTGLRRDTCNGEAETAE